MMNVSLLPDDQPVVEVRHKLQVFLLLVHPHHLQLFSKQTLKLLLKAGEEAWRSYRESGSLDFKVSGYHKIKGLQMKQDRSSRDQEIRRLHLKVKVSQPMLLESLPCQK